MNQDLIRVSLVNATVQVTGSYPSVYYPTQTTQTDGFDFTSILQMFMPVMMMAVVDGMVGDMMRGEKKKETTSQEEEPAAV
ncbi:hypothetical protein ACFLVE_03055 [Chloroflexota bacterium]